jgi:hypothetical protein
MVQLVQLVQLFNQGSELWAAQLQHHAKALGPHLHGRILVTVVFGNWRVVFGNWYSETGSGVRKLESGIRKLGVVFGNWKKVFGN